jgi:protein TonB
MAALAKAVAICVGTAGGTVACVATGVVPAPLELGGHQSRAAVVERRIDPIVVDEWESESGVEAELTPTPEAAPEPVAVEHEPAPEPTVQPAVTTGPEPASGAVEYAPPPEPAPVAAPAIESTPPSSAGGGSPAGEFGP